MTILESFDAFNFVVAQIERLQIVIVGQVANFSNLIERKAGLFEIERRQKVKQLLQLIVGHIQTHQILQFTQHGQVLIIIPAFNILLNK